MKLDISYRQLCVFDPDLENPFNDWEQQHSAQGFTWRKGSVSFATLMDSGPVDLTLEIDSVFRPDEAAVRVIQVPFTVPASGQIEVGTVISGVLIELPPGEYNLFFQAYGRTVRLAFVAGRGDFNIIRQDAELSPSFPLLTTAEPA